MFPVVLDLDQPGDTISKVQDVNRLRPAGHGLELFAMERPVVVSRPVTVMAGDAVVSGRVRALRKTREAVGMAYERWHRAASRKGTQLQHETLEFACYIIVFTTFPALMSASQVLEWYRIRWQIGWMFKRFESLAQLGHLPKYDDESAKAWLYDRLLVEKLIPISP